jgi:hypothetical protein
MKYLILAATVGLGLACAGNASAAQYETYSVDLHFGYGLRALVAHSPAEYAKAQRDADRSEGARHLGLGPQTIVTVAIDNSAGVAKEIRWSAPDNTVAVVDIH